VFGPSHWVPSAGAERLQTVQGLREWIAEEAAKIAVLPSEAARKRREALGAELDARVAALPPDTWEHVKFPVDLSAKTLERQAEPTRTELQRLREWILAEDLKLALLPPEAVRRREIEILCERDEKIEQFPSDTWDHVEVHIPWAKE